MLFWYNGLLMLWIVDGFGCNKTRRGKRGKEVFFFFFQIFWFAKKTFWNFWLGLEKKKKKFPFLIFIDWFSFCFLFVSLIELFESAQRCEVKSFRNEYLALKYKYLYFEWFISFNIREYWILNEYFGFKILYFEWFENIEFLTFFGSKDFEI